MKVRLFVVLSLVLLLVGVLPLAAQDAETFPITIEHQFGTITLPEAPERIVAIGYSEQDYWLALGITPVVVRYWYGDEPNAIFPWAVEYVEGEAPVVLNMPFGGLSYEAILALEPDLISAVTAGISEEEYALLSEIAPTLAQSGDYINFGMPWQEITQLIGDSVGKGEEASALVSDIQAQFEAAVEANPEFVDKTVSVAYYSNSTYGIYTEQDIRGRFFTDLGFVIPEEYNEVAGASFYADISTERLDLLDQDLIAILNLQFIEGGRATLDNDPLFSQLNAAKEGNVIFLEETAENALGFSTPLSLSYALDAVLPQLQEVFGTAEATAAVETVACEAGYRLFDHEYLGTDPVCIPENPERIAVLDLSPLEAVLLQGIEPVAVYGYGRDLIARSNPNITVDVLGLTAESADIGAANAVNLEVLLSTAPDLIIASGSTVRINGLETLEAIAPTVSFAYPLDVSEYRASVDFVTAVLNVPEVNEEVTAALDSRLATFQELLGEGVGNTEISLVRQRDALVVFVSGSFGDHLIHEAGLIRPEHQQEYDLDFVINQNNNFVGFDVSKENLGLLDGEYLFIWTASPSAEVEAEIQNILNTLLEDPLWSALTAAQNENLFIVGSHWQGFGIFEAHAGLDDLFRNVLGVDPQEVAPNPFLAE